MGLIDRILSWGEQTLRTWRVARTIARKATIGEQIFSRLLGSGSTYTWPGGWSADRIEMTAHMKHWVYIAVRTRYERFAELPPNIALVKSEIPDAPATEARADAISRATRAMLADTRFKKTAHAIKPHEQIEHVGDNHPLVRLLAKPNALEVAWDFWAELNMFLDLTGNCYVWVVPNKLGLPAELWVIPAHWVRPRLAMGKEVNEAGLIEYYEVQPFIGSSAMRIPANEIIWLRTPNPMHMLDGYSPQTAGAEWIDAGESVDQSRFWQFKNGCFPIGAVQLGSKYEGVDQFDLERYQAQFYARIQGEAKYGLPIIMPPDAEYKPLTIAPVEMGYIESADQLKDWILALYNVPKEVVGLQPTGSDLSWYAPMLLFARQAIAPRLQYLGQALTARLAMRYDPHLRLWWDDPTPNNPQQINSDIAQDLAARAISPNEVRAIRGRDPWPGGDDPITPVGESPMPLATGEALPDFLPSSEQIQMDQQQQQQQQAAAAAGAPGGAPGLPGSNGQASANGQAPPGPPPGPDNGGDDDDGGPPPPPSKNGHARVNRLARNGHLKCGGPGSGKPGPCPEGGGTAVADEPDTPASQAIADEPKVRRISAELRDKLKQGGFTYDLAHEDSPKEGYSVSIHPEAEKIIPKLADVNEGTIRDYLKATKNTFKTDPQAMAGGWVDEHGKVFLDVVRVVPTKREAAHLAKDNNQEGFYGLKEGKTWIVKPPRLRRQVGRRILKTRSLRFSAGYFRRGDRRRYSPSRQEAQAGTAVRNRRGGGRRRLAKGSYLEDCPRDTGGHCLPHDQADQSGQHQDKPAADHEAAPETVTPERRKHDQEKFVKLRDDWARVNNDLLDHLDQPDSPEAKKLSEKLKGIVKEMHTLYAAPVGWEAGPKGVRDIVVIGAGPGGIAASIMGATDGLNTMFIEQNTETGGQSKYSSRIENFPGFPIGVKGHELAIKSKEQAERLGAEGRYGVSVKKLEVDPETGEKVLSLSNGEKVRARSVVIAGGLEFRRVKFPGGDSDRVVYGDGEKLAEVGKGKPVVVVGGSNGAAQAAIGAAKTASTVYVLSRSALEKGMSRYQIDALKTNPKIQVIVGDGVAKFNAENDVVDTRNGKHLEAHAIGMFVGSVPKMDYLPHGMHVNDKSGKIEVNENLETNIPGVFAVGDIRHGSIGRVGASVGDGQVAEHGVTEYFKRTKEESEMPLFGGAPKSLVRKAGKKQAKRHEIEPLTGKARDRANAEWDTLVDGLFDLDDDYPAFGSMAEAPPRLAAPPDVRQEQAGSCGAAALRTVCKGFGVGPDDEADYRALLDTSVRHGTAVENMVHVAKVLGLHVLAAPMQLDEGASHIERGAWIICPVQASGDGSGNDKGHYVVWFATTPTSVLVQDPDSEQGGRKRIGKKLWLARWHDVDADGTAYNQFGIVCYPPESPGGSYLSDCPRDTEGHCLPHDQANESGQQTDQPESEDVKAAVADYQTNHTKAKAFKAWFGDWEKGEGSKVVDEAGAPAQTHSLTHVGGANTQPVAVYHGTSHGGFDTFDKAHLSDKVLFGKGFYFTTGQEIAQAYASPTWQHNQAGGRDDGEAKQPEIKKVFLAIRKPFDLDQLIPEEDAKKIAAAFDGQTDRDFGPNSHEQVGTTMYGALYAHDYGLSEPPTGQVYAGDVIAAINRVFPYTGARKITAYLQEQGYDGVTRRDSWAPGIGTLKGKNYRTWIAFEPPQIKAVENRGTFDPKSPSIYKSMQGRGKLRLKNALGAP